MITMKCQDLIVIINKIEFYLAKVILVNYKYNYRLENEEINKIF